MMVIAAMAEIANHAENHPWPSLDTASRLFDRASVVLAISLIFGAAATILIVWMGVVKEHHWDLLRERAASQVATLELETARANAEVAKAHEGIAAAGAEVAKANESAAKANERAAELKLDLEREIAAREPRKISAEQRERIIALLRPATVLKGKVLVNPVMDGEAWQYSSQILSVLEAAGYDTSEMDGGQRLVATNRPGLYLWVKDAENQPKHGAPIFNVFKSVGIPITAAVDASVPDLETVVIAVSSHP